MSSVPSHEEAVSTSTRDLEKAALGGSRLINRKRAVSNVKPEIRVVEEADLEESEPRDDEEGGHGQLPATDGRAGHAPRLNSIWSSAELERLIEGEELDLETYDVNEFRDGFCDALFLSPRAADTGELLRRAERTLPRAFRKKHPLSLRNFIPKQWHEVRSVAYRVTRTRAGIKLLKAFAAYFTAYALCLVPWVRAWLGRYNYIMVVSTIVNHPGRTVGAQIDGTVMTVLGTAMGLGWGAFGLWLSTSSASAQIGYAGILALFLCIYIGLVAALRSYFIRLYQFVICAGMAVTYTCLAEVSSEEVAWGKLFQYGVPWVIGQAIALATCILCFPDAGARGLAVSLNDAFETMLDALDTRKSQRRLARQRLAQTFINLSQVYRDLSIDITVTRFDPRDVLALRNLLQAVVRALLAMRPEPGAAGLQDSPLDESPGGVTSIFQALVQTTVLATPGLSDVAPGPLLTKIDTKERAVRLVRYQLDDPTKRLLKRMTEALQSGHAVLMDMSGYRSLGPSAEVPSDVAGALVKLRKAIIKFDQAESSLLDGEELQSKFVPEVIELFAYCRPIRQAATSVEAALVKVNEMQQRRRRMRVYLPSYPWRKALNRANAQIRHDRGGVTAAAYFKSFADIQRLISKIKSSEHYIIREEHEDLFRAATIQSEATHVTEEPMAEDGRPLLKRSKVRHSIWKVAHHLQGFEMRFALKTAIVTSLLALPAWLDNSRMWWKEYEAWWAVAMAWLMMHPRVGGNAQDLITRALLGALGAIWAGAGYAAGNGNPFVMGAFAIIYIRSGLVGCLSFTVTSLALLTGNQDTPPLATTISRGVAFVVGVVASVIINWIIWPFVARHELRKALSEMMFFLGVTYRTIIGRYVYNDQGPSPTKEDIERSEVLEGRLREGFVRIRQLLGLTRHEIRLRGPFDPLPYSALADSCERFFEYLVAVRQSSLFFHPKFVRDNDEAVERLLCHRRDAVASILTNLYILAGALKSNRQVPKYLPSAAAARKRLMDKMVEIEAEYEEDEYKLDPQKTEQRKWVQIYQYSYNESLTGCVAQLEELERYTKLIVGEHGFDDFYSDSSEGED
ncbi:hypothetical protein GQ53DRAFT_829632 [Thozetella sp. PMI_491]|nr:hypothetical protein GQ53DRAFT_829632 [Thozetella sp. PMI_491]